MNNYGSIRIIGESSISKGAYDKITIIGEAKSSGKVECNSLNVLGTLDLEDEFKACDMKIVGEVTASCKVESTGKVKLLGELVGDDDFIINTVNIIGQGIFKKNLTFNNIDLLGELTVSGNCEGNIFYSKGKASIDGLLSADKIEINPKDSSFINEIGGSEIIIRNTGWNVFSNGKVISNTIEGDKIILEQTHCKIVRGHDIKILRDCNIDRIEYTGTITVDERSSVGEVICMKN
ncbi:hypothetical protein [Clostridium sp. LP20]|uniref:hypothetical protein n=1 Tax=Clostridium sp. LP20 TaxID=3418665 RepID=UPI003EE44D36